MFKIVPIWAGGRLASDNGMVKVGHVKTHGTGRWEMGRQETGRWMGRKGGHERM